MSRDNECSLVAVKAMLVECRRETQAKRLQVLTYLIDMAIAEAEEELHGCDRAETYHSVHQPSL